jgi:hypothetical protein
MIRERSHCLDLDQSARSRWSDSKDSDDARRSHRPSGLRHRPTLGRLRGQIDRQFGNMLGVSPGLSEHGEHIAHGLLRLCFESIEQSASAVRAVLPADV